jgi:transposase
MHDRDLYAQILGISKPWMVADVALSFTDRQVTVFVEPTSDAEFLCSACQKACPGYDSRLRSWRHLDTCQYKTILTAKVPRIECGEHGVQQVMVPWAEPNSHFTALFEVLAISWLKEANISAVGGLMGLTWAEVDGIMQRAVARGLARRESKSPTAIGVDETSFKKRHKYVTVISDSDENTVIHVADDRKAESLSQFYETLSPEERERIEVATMDMHEPFIKATKEAIPDAEKKIAFDRFHVAKHLGDAVDKVRKIEHAALMAKGDMTLKGTKHMWLFAEENLKSPVMQGMFDALKGAELKTARAYAIKETARGLWNFISRGWAQKAWKRWISWAMRSKLEPIKKAAEMVRKHLWGIINGIVLQATNAAAESMNAKIQRIKRMACGFRSSERFKNAIYFHLGGLDLYPASANLTHTNN